MFGLGDGQSISWTVRIFRPYLGDLYTGLGLIVSNVAILISLYYKATEKGKAQI